MISSIFVIQSTHHPVKIAVTSIVVTAGLLCSPPSFGGKLGTTRKAVRRAPEKDESADESYSDSSDDDDDGNLALACLIPFILPFCLISAGGSSETRESESSPRAYFLSYPYADDAPGHLVIEKPDSLALNDTISRSTATGRITAEYDYDLDMVHIPTLAIAVDSTPRIGFDTRWQLFLEPEEEALDKLVMGSLNLTFRLFQHPTLETHLGIGGRLMVSDQVDGGFNALLRLMLFPVRPIVGTLEVNLGNLGHAFFLEGQFSIGASLHHAELFAGYWGTLIAGSKESVYFHGPRAGVRFWF
jgi:hypothetical protein